MTKYFASCKLVYHKQQMVSLNVTLGTAESLNLLTYLRPECFNVYFAGLKEIEESNIIVEAFFFMFSLLLVNLFRNTIT